MGPAQPGARHDPCPFAMDQLPRSSPGGGLTAGQSAQPGAVLHWSSFCLANLKEQGILIWEQDVFGYLDPVSGKAKSSSLSHFQETI